MRAFEEAHAYSGSRLHLGALADEPDVSRVRLRGGAASRRDAATSQLVVLGQSHELFEAAGFDVRSWQIVQDARPPPPAALRRQRARSRVFIASASDIDDLVPIVTAYQIEWNKMHARLRSARHRPRRRRGDRGSRRARASARRPSTTLRSSRRVRPARLERGDRGARRPRRSISTCGCSRRRTRSTSARRSAGGAASSPRTCARTEPRRPPVYFVSSNTHALANLVGGYARTHADEIVDLGATQTNPEGLGAEVASALARTDDARARAASSTTCSAATSTPIAARRAHARGARVRGRERASSTSRSPATSTSTRRSSSSSKLDPALLDPRLRVPGIERLTQSDAFIVNIDYPLGMAAYHLLSRARPGRRRAARHLRHGQGRDAQRPRRRRDAQRQRLRRALAQHVPLQERVHRARRRAVPPARQRLRQPEGASRCAARSSRTASTWTRSIASGYTVLEMEAGPFLGARLRAREPDARPAPTRSSTSRRRRRSTSASCTTRRTRRTRAASRSCRRASASSASTAPTRARSRSCAGSSSARSPASRADGTLLALKRGAAPFRAVSCPRARRGCARSARRTS